MAIAMARRSWVVASLLRASLLRRPSPRLSEQSISSSAPHRLSFGWFDKVKSAFTGKPSANSSASKIAFSLTVSVEFVDQMDFAILHYLGAIAIHRKRWKEGMDLFANGNAQEKKGSKHSFVEKSFFSWFNKNLHKNLSEGVMDEVAEIIKEDLWPNPLKYFNNEIDEDDFDGEDDEEETDGDYGEDDDGAQDDDDEEDEDRD